MESTQEPNYVKKMARLLEAGVIKRGEVYLLDVAHDDWCRAYRHLPCNCNPDIINRETGEVLNRREDSQR